MEASSRPGHRASRHPHARRPKAETAPIMANRILARVSRLFSFAVERDWIEANPALRIGKPADERSRDRVLSRDELREAVEVVADLPRCFQSQDMNGHLRWVRLLVLVEPRWNPGTRKVVGATGFEPATPCAQGRCATRLRYAPTGIPNILARL